MKLIVGLGNYGGKYASNRHNVGFMAVDEIFDAYDFSPWRKRFSGEVCEGRIGRTKCLMLKPSTYMNESGRSVGEAARFYKLDLDDVIVLYDEIDLVAGKLKAKTGGGNAGHNGLRSISNHLGNDYHRVRIGVGRPAQKSQVSNYVLRDFNKSDQQWLVPLLDAIARKFETFLECGSRDFLNQVVEHLVPFEEKPSKKSAKKPQQDSLNDKNTISKDAQSKTSQKASQSDDRGPLADMLNLWKKTDTDKE
ncbi:MAG: aminoacyl-tRNA hydrolase [bacterium]|nr:aminoacyl-tRNA hydrolase [bacterium]